MASAFNPPITKFLSPPRFSFHSLNRNRFSALRTVANPNKSEKATTLSMASGKRKVGDVKVFNTQEDLSTSLVKYIVDLSDKFIKKRGAFTVVSSGGDLFNSLSKLVEPPYVQTVDWSKWFVFWVDERLVPKNHPESNYFLAFRHFLSKVPILPGNAYSINEALSVEAAAADYETCIKHLVNDTPIINHSACRRFPKFDLMLINMGTDGHVSSFFPGHPLLQENKKWVTCIKDSPKPPQERITFTFPVINSSANVAAVIVGADKAEPVHVALGNGESSDLLPIQMVSPEGDLVWFLDKGSFKTVESIKYR